MRDFESSNPTSYWKVQYMILSATVPTLENHFRFVVNWKYKFPMRWPDVYILSCSVHSRDAPIV